MHFHSFITANQILWTFTFAALLVLLVVLYGRDRAARFPLFTASIVLLALRQLSGELLAGRISQLVLRTVFIPLAMLSALLGLLVVMEVAFRAFTGVARRVRLAWTLAAMAVAAAVLYFWGPWPSASALAVDSPVALLRLLDFMAQKTDLGADVLTVQLGLLILIFGRNYSAGWRTHAQTLSIGLSTTALAGLAVQGIWQAIVLGVQRQPLTRPEYERVVGIGNHLVNANKAIYILVLVGWIVGFWLDEPGKTTPQTNQDASMPELPSEAPVEPGTELANTSDSASGGAQ
jgi:hypothetical protein